MLSLDRVRPAVDAGEFVAVDLAAVPAPGLQPNPATFHNNAAGIRNLVWASSEPVLGLPFDAPRRTSNADTVMSRSGAEPAAEVYPRRPAPQGTG